MKTNELKQLLARYYDGETSLEDENALKAYFNGDSAPEEFEADRKMFLFFAKESEVSIEDNGFDERILDKISRDKTERKSNIIRYATYAISGIAASLILFFNLNLNHPETPLFDKAILGGEHSPENPEKAYEETKKALILVSANLNKGFENLSRIDEFNNGLGQLQKLSKFEECTKTVLTIQEGLQHVLSQD